MSRAPIVSAPMLDRSEPVPAFEGTVNVNVRMPIPMTRALDQYRAVRSSGLTVITRGDIVREGLVMLLKSNGYLSVGS